MRLIFLKKYVSFIGILLFFLSIELFVSCGAPVEDIVQRQKSDLFTPVVEAVSIRLGSIQLTWPAVLGASYYEIYRDVSEDGLFESLLKSVVLNAYVDRPKQSGTYYYKIRWCTNDRVCSELSSVTSVINISSNRIIGRYSVQFSFSALDSALENINSQESVYVALYDSEVLIGEISDATVADLYQSENPISVHVLGLRYENLYLFPGRYAMRLYIANSELNPEERGESVFDEGTLFATKSIDITNENLVISSDADDIRFKTLHKLRLNIYFQDAGETPAALSSSFRDVLIEYKVVCRVHLHDYSSSDALILNGQITATPNYVSMQPVGSSRFKALVEGKYKYICFIDIDNDGILDNSEPTSSSALDNSSSELLSVPSLGTPNRSFMSLSIDPPEKFEGAPPKLVSDSVLFTLSEGLFVSSYKILRLDDNDVFVSIKNISTDNERIVVFRDTDIRVSKNERQTYKYKILVCVMQSGSSNERCSLQSVADSLVVDVPPFAEGFSVSQSLDSYIANVNSSIRVSFDFTGDGLVTKYLLFDSDGDNVLLNESNSNDIFLDFNVPVQKDYKIQICNYNSDPDSDPEICSDLENLAVNLPYIVSSVTNIRPNGNALLKELTIFQDRLFFTGNDGRFGEELWSYDYNSLKTDILGLCSSETNPCLIQDLAVREIIPNIPRHSYPSSLVIDSDSLYFSAFHENTGSELYKYTSSSTPSIVLVKDIAPGKAFLTLGNEINPKESFPQHLFVDGGNIYFSAVTSQAGREPWVYNIGEGTVSLLADLNHLGYSSEPEEFIRLGSYIYFVADGQILNGVTRMNTGRELWRYNPNVPRTVSFKLCSEKVYEDAVLKTSNPCLTEEIVQGKLGSSIRELRKFDSTEETRLYFIASKEGEDSLWYYDVSLELTSGIKRMNSFNTSLSNIESLTVHSSSTIFFVGYKQDIGKELWNLDVSLPISSENDFAPCSFTNSANPCYIDIRSDSSLYLFPEKLFVKNNKLFFEARYGIYERELWVYDINLDTTFSNLDFDPFCWKSASNNPCMLADIKEGSYSSFPDNFTSKSGLDRVFFTVEQGKSLWEIKL